MIANKWLGAGIARDAAKNAVHVVAPRFASTVRRRDDGGVSHRIQLADSSQGATASRDHFPSIFRTTL